MDSIPQWQAEAARLALAKMAPDVVGEVEPVLPRLFQALADGDSCIALAKHEQARLHEAKPIVGGPQQASTPLIQFADKLTLGRVWQLEAEIASHLHRLSRPVNPEQDLSGLLQTLFDGQSSSEQQQAAALACVNQLAIITGGPGTGKTTTVAKLLCLLSFGMAAPPRIALAAPTGKAAARMTESLRFSLQQLRHSNAEVMTDATASALLALEGKTLHRMLGMMPPKMLPKYDAEQVLPYDIVIVDETSMLDSAMLKHLLAAIGDATRLILLGDADQLPPVGMGEFLSLLPAQTCVLPKQLASLQAWLPHVAWHSAATPAALAAQTARLTVSHRFGADSGIGKLAAAVLHQQVDVFAELFDAQDDIVLKPAPDYARNLAWSLWLAQQSYWHAVERGVPAEVFAAWTARMLLTVRRRDAEQVNAALRDILAKQGIWQPEKGLWYHGQAIMITRNDAEMGLFNGDVGVVLRDEAQRLQAYFPTHDGMRAVPLSRLPAHEDAFAMTVHKSQGSEFAEVWLLPPLGALEAAEDYHRALLYTAITRAKQYFVYWGDVSSLQAASARHVQRLTVLGHLLQHEH